MEETLKRIIRIVLKPLALVLAILTDDPSFLFRRKEDDRTVPDEASEETRCMVCQATMPAGADTCSKCGWSYNVSEPVDES